MESTKGTVFAVRFLFQLFIRIQQARGFEDELGRYHLHLQAQLSNCSRLMRVLSNAGNSSAPNAINSPENTSEEHEPTLLGILHAIWNALQKAQQEAAKIQADLTTTGLRLQDPNTYTTAINLKTMRTRATAFLDKQKGQVAKTSEAIKWAFYKRDICYKRITDISVLMRDLERQIASESLALRDARVMFMFTFMVNQWRQYEMEYSNT